MPWIRFTSAFDFKPSPNAVIAYKSGNTYLVKKDCADKAIADGKGVSVSRPKADDAGG